MSMIKEPTTEDLLYNARENNKKLKQEINKYKKALEEIKEIIEFRFKTAYMTFGLKETDKIIEDIEKIANEVLNDRD